MSEGDRGGSREWHTAALELKRTASQRPHRSFARQPRPLTKEMCGCRQLQGSNLRDQRSLDGFRHSGADSSLTP